MLLSVAALVLSTILVVGPALARLPRAARVASEAPGATFVSVARSGTLAWALADGSEVGRLACASRGRPRFEVALLWRSHPGRSSAPQGDADSTESVQALGRTLALADTLQGRLEGCALMEPAVGRQVGPAMDGDVPEITVTPALSVSNVVHFAFDRADVRGHSATVLDSVAMAILQVPGALVELVGHTDVRGPSEYNAALGERRADAVQRYLQGRGVAAERIQARSMGEEDNYRPNARSNRDHALNRRVEIRFVTPGTEPIRVHRQDRDLKFTASRQSIPSELAPVAAPPRLLVVSPAQTAGASDARLRAASAFPRSLHMSPAGTPAPCQERRFTMRSGSRACPADTFAHRRAASPSRPGFKASARRIDTIAEPLSRSTVEGLSASELEWRPRNEFSVGAWGQGTAGPGYRGREVELRLVRGSSGLSEAA